MSAAMEKKIVNDFSFNQYRDDRSVLFDYPIKIRKADDFIPSLKQMFMSGVWPSGDGVFVEGIKAYAEALEWLRQNVREGYYKAYGRYEKVIFKQKGDIELLVDGDGVRYGVLFRFLRERDAAAFRMFFG
jgi:TPR repeat protein